MSCQSFIFECAEFRFLTAIVDHTLFGKLFPRTFRSGILFACGLGESIKSPFKPFREAWILQQIEGG